MDGDRDGVLPVPSPHADLRACVGLRPLLESLRSHAPGRVLDLGGISQASVDSFAAAGHHLYTESLLRAVEKARRGEMATGAFLEENFRYPMDHFDAVLCWDLLEFLPSALLGSVVERLHEVSRPGARLLAFFHSAPVGPLVHPSRFEIVGEDVVRTSSTSSTLDVERPLTRRDLDNLFRARFGMNDVLAPDGLHEILLVKPHRAVP